MKAIQPAAFLALVLLLTAWSPEAAAQIVKRPVVQRQCTINSDCAGEFVCSSGACRAACADDRSCPSGARCMLRQPGQAARHIETRTQDAGLDQFRRCETADGSRVGPSDIQPVMLSQDERRFRQCSYNSECAPGLLCRTDIGACVEACRSSRDCPGAGHVCSYREPGRYALFDLAGGAGDPRLEGRGNSQFLACTARPRCLGDADCPGGQQCVIRQPGAAVPVRVAATPRVFAGNPDPAHFACEAPPRTTAGAAIWPDPAKAPASPPAQSSGRPAPSEQALASAPTVAAAPQSSMQSAAQTRVPTAIAVPMTAARYFRGADGALWHRSASGQESRTTAGPISIADLSQVSRSGGADAVFIRAADQALWMIECTATQCGQWTNLGGQFRSAPAAQAQGDGTIAVSVTGMDGKPWRIVVRDRSVVSGWKPAP